MLQTPFNLAVSLPFARRLPEMVRWVVFPVLLLATPLSGREPSGLAQGPLMVDWRSAGRNVQPTCVDIKAEMQLCHGIGYNKMRLPNLLGHDSIAEVVHQAASWVPLLNVRCHTHTQLFLCSLFSPVCLDRPIYPCRSLCQQVKQGCEKRMKTYGYPWPEMFECERFPEDDDMCISAHTRSRAPNEEGTVTPDEKCTVCNQPDTYENILDHFCRSDFAVRVKIQKVRKARLIGRKAKILKGGEKFLKQLKRPVMTLEPMQSCCQKMTSSSTDNFLVMGSVREAKVTPNFIMPWATKRSKSFKNAVRMFKKLNCSDSKLPQSLINAALTSSDPFYLPTSTSPQPTSPSTTTTTSKTPKTRQNRKKTSNFVLG
nr:PREDICTED: secreted frizzled-related protein 5-like [Bemisia tabaci]XP_018901741.1 PREDICTED: secreted frizzled-related protein 5-like [Bemisia tabaci]